MSLTKNLLALLLISISSSTYAVKTNLWQELLSKYLNVNGGVDYVGFNKDKLKLTEYIESFATIKPVHWSENKKKAEYINLYNAVMISNILKYATTKKIVVASDSFTKIKINDIKVDGGNIWNGSYKVKVAGVMVNLDNIEHNLIRGLDNSKLNRIKVKQLDPRIHTAVNCAALSCPKVLKQAYTENTIDNTLTLKITDFLSNNSQFKLIKKGKLQANSIVYWYYSDFDDYAQKTLKLKGAGTWLSSFFNEKTKNKAEKTKILNDNFNDRSKMALRFSSSFDFEYNWLINDIRNK